MLAGIMPALASDPVLRQALGHRIKDLRKAHGWTMKELAAKLVVGTTHLNKYEAGIHAPPVEKLALLASLFSVSVDYLLTGQQPDNRPISSQPLLERFRALEAVSADDQTTIVNVIDAVIAKNRVASALRPVAPPPLAHTG
jgi:transcriptional regulator with XRE-family HTH domain